MERTRFAFEPSRRDHSVAKYVYFKIPLQIHLGPRQLSSPFGFKKPSMRSKTTSFEIKNADLPLIALVVKTQDFYLLQQEFEHKLQENTGFFSGEPAVIDLMQLESPQADPTLDLMALCALVKKHGLHAIAVKCNDPHWAAEAHKAGIFEATEFLHTGKPVAQPDVSSSTLDFEQNPIESAPSSTEASEALAMPQATETVREVLIPQASTLIITKPLRSGQRAYAKGGDLVVLAMVNPGAEVMADGHIHVYAPLRGRAIAGAKGDTSARIFTSCLEAQLLSIAGIYRTSEVDIPKEFLGKGAQVSLDGDKLVMQVLG